MSSAYRSPKCTKWTARDMLESFLFLPNDDSPLRSAHSKSTNHTNQTSGSDTHAGYLSAEGVVYLRTECSSVDRKVQHEFMGYSVKRLRTMKELAEHLVNNYGFYEITQEFTSEETALLKRCKECRTDGGKQLFHPELYRSSGQGTGKLKKALACITLRTTLVDRKPGEPHKISGEIYTLLNGKMIENERQRNAELELITKHLDNADERHRRDNKEIEALKRVNASLKQELAQLKARRPNDHKDTQTDDHTNRDSRRPSLAKSQAIMRWLQRRTSFSTYQSSEMDIGELADCYENQIARLRETASTPSTLQPGEEQSNWPPDESLAAIAHIPGISEHWRSIATCLDLDEHEVKEVEEHHGSTIVVTKNSPRRATNAENTITATIDMPMTKNQGRLYRVLKTWRDTTQGTTIGACISALETIGHKEIVKDVLKSGCL